ncbi:MAG TPA: alpha/beta hydrolase [Vineibacter sp.]|nr:alpha/beta hydrolase [Vineibacter sp.]
MRRGTLGLLLAVALLGAPGPRGMVRAEPVQLRHDGRTLNADLALPTDGSPADGLVILVHGTLMHGRMEIMAALQRHLAARGVASLAITLSLGLDDRRGPYECATPHRHTLNQTADEIGAWTRWARERGARHVDLAGHSRGGAQVAYALAIKAASDVRRAVLIAPATFDAGDVATGYEKTFGLPLPPLLAGAMGLVAAPGALLRPVGFLHCRDTAVAPRTFLDTYTGPERHDTPSLLVQFATPTLIMVAGNDEIVRGLGPRVRTVPGHVRVVSIDGADHSFRDLHGEDLADAVAAFLKQ